MDIKNASTVNGEGSHIPYYKDSNKVSRRKNHWLLGNKHWIKRGEKDGNTETNEAEEPQNVKRTDLYNRRSYKHNTP